MLRISQFAGSDVWFASRVSPLDLFKICRYKKFLGSNASIFLMRGLIGHTIEINIDGVPDEVIRANYEKNTRYEVNRASKIGFYADASLDLSGFVNFYKSFAINSGLNPISSYQRFAGKLVVTRCNFGADTYVMHSHLFDKEIGIARLLHSASSCEVKNENRVYVGYANRYLHDFDFRYFRDAGAKIYDLGGYSLDTADPKLIGINKFKKGFGGTIVEVREFSTYPRVLAEFVLGAIR